MIKSLRQPLILITLVSGLLSPFASAGQCNVNLNYGVVIDPSHIRVLNQDKTVIQINDNHQLFIQGREILVSNSQQALLNDYANGIRQQVPEIVSIAIEGVDVGFKAVNKVIAGVTGENSASHQKLQKQFEQLQWQLRKRFNQSDQNFYIAPQDFDDFDEIFAGQFEKEIESIITESIGTILMAVGEAITNNEESNSEHKTRSFDERMTALGDELELEMSDKVNSLEAKAEIFCSKLKALDKLENQLAVKIPQLSQFDLISSN